MGQKQAAGGERQAGEEVGTSISITGLGPIEEGFTLWFTVKRSFANADSAAVLQLLSGLDGGITIDDAESGDITVDCPAETTAAIAPRTYVYDIQLRRGDGEIQTLAIGEFVVLPDVTRATDLPEEE